MPAEEGQRPQERTRPGPRPGKMRPVYEVDPDDDGEPYRPEGDDRRYLEALRRSGGRWE